MKMMLRMMPFWLSIPNLQVSHMNLNRFWIIMSYKFVIIFIAKFWSSGKIDPTKDPIGKTLVLYVRGFLLLFLRMKTLH